MVEGHDGWMGGGRVDKGSILMLGIMLGNMQSRGLSDAWADQA